MSEFDLDDARGARITVRQLLAHTSGSLRTRWSSLPPPTLRNASPSCAPCRSCPTPAPATPTATWGTTPRPAWWRPGRGSPSGPTSSGTSSRRWRYQLPLRAHRTRPTRARRRPRHRVRRGSGPAGDGGDDHRFRQRRQHGPRPTWPLWLAMQQRGGVAPDGTRLLSEELLTRSRTSGARCDLRLGVGSRRRRLHRLDASATTAHSPLQRPRRAGAQQRLRRGGPPQQLHRSDEAPVRDRRRRRRAQRRTHTHTGRPLASIVYAHPRLLTLATRLATGSTTEQGVGRATPGVLPLAFWSAAPAAPRSTGCDLRVRRAAGDRRQQRHRPGRLRPLSCADDAARLQRPRRGT